MGHDANGRELSEEEVREILAETRPAEGRGVLVDGPRSTAALRRSVAGQPQGQVAGLLADGGSPSSPNQTVPAPVVPVTPVAEAAADGGGVVLRSAADEEPDAAPQSGTGEFTRDQLEQLPRPTLDEIAAERGVTPEPGSGSGPDGAVTDVDVVNAIVDDQSAGDPAEAVDREGDDEK